MGQPTLPENSNDRSAEPKGSTGLGWSEFFHELGQGPEVTEGRSSQGNVERIQERTLYSSENGDRWSLVRHTDDDRVFVRHQPNPASGGQVSDMEVGAFLSRGGMGPEKQELLRLIGSAVRDPETGA